MSSRAFLRMPCHFVVVDVAMVFLCCLITQLNAGYTHGVQICPRETSSTALRGNVQETHKHLNNILHFISILQFGLVVGDHNQLISDVKE